MSSVAAVIPMVLMAVGTAVSAYGQIQAGNAAEQAAAYNASIAQQQAAEASQAAKSKAFDLSTQRRTMIGRQVAAFGASGVDVNSGTPLDVMSHTATQYEMDIQNAGIAADQATQSGYEQAQLDLMQGKQAQTAGWINAGASVFGGLGKAAQVFNSSSMNLGG